MSKSKLELLLEAIKNRSFYTSIEEAYQAYMEERKTIPHAGQEIEVSDDEQEWVIRKFIAFCPSGRCIAYNEGDKRGATFSYPWQHYRIPTPKKKWKVVRHSYSIHLIFPEDYQTDLPIITTFED